MNVSIELEPATENRVTRAVVSVTEKGNTETVIWIRQPRNGWTTVTGYPAHPDLGAFLDYLLTREGQ